MKTAQDEDLCVFLLAVTRRDRIRNHHRWRSLKMENSGGKRSGHVLIGRSLRRQPKNVGEVKLPGGRVRKRPTRNFQDERCHW